MNPDMVLVSNAIAGGLPISVLLLKPELDHWRPGDQVGLFQGDNLAFVAATEILSQWNDALVRDIAERSEVLAAELQSIPARFPNRHLRVRGKGMSWGTRIRPAGGGVRCLKLGSRARSHRRTGASQGRCAARASSDHHQRRNAARRTGPPE